MLTWSDCLFAMCLTAPPLQGSHSLEKSLNLREIFEKSLNPIFPWKVLEFSSTLNVVAWKVVSDAFWLSKTEYES